MKRVFVFITQKKIKFYLDRRTDECFENELILKKRKMKQHETQFHSEKGNKQTIFGIGSTKESKNNKKTTEDIGRFESAALESSNAYKVAQEHDQFIRHQFRVDADIVIISSPSRINTTSAYSALAK